MSDKYITNYKELKIGRETLQFSKKGVLGLLQFINESDEPICVCGSGTSYLVAEGISKVINSITGIITFSKRPRDFWYYNQTKLNRMIFVSFSNNRKEYEQIKTNSCKSIILSFCNGEKEYGDNITSVDGEMHKKVYFNSPQAALILIEFVYYCLSGKCINSFSYWENAIRSMPMVNNIKVAVFCGDNSEFAARDIKNKFEESVYGIVDIYEKRDFSHGKFISFNSRVFDIVIYLRQNQESKYEDELLDYLNNKCNTVLIQSRYTGIEAEIDLLQGIQTVFYRLCQSKDIDFGNAYVDEIGEKLFHYSGKFY